jgi:hypothetical protein
MKNGINCENTFINHIPTYTAVGHAGIYTGSYPSKHGIVGNYWYDKSSNKKIYCTFDSTVSSVGTASDNGKMSPRNLQSNTITDELRMSNNFKSRVFSFSIKDRGSILPGGFTANAAYWYDDVTGKVITSSYYMNKLPNWVSSFNETNKPEFYFKNNWNTSYPINEYIVSSEDSSDFEVSIPDENNVVFPHHINSSSSKKYEAFKYTPFANSFSFNFVKSLIKNENIGKNGVTDFLNISLSATDYIGHNFGPNSIEVEDTYVKLDKEIAGFINYLDSVIGPNKYLLFLTADHGVDNSPLYLKSIKIPSQRINAKDLLSELNDSLFKTYNIKGLVLKLENQQLYIDYDKIMKENSSLADVNNSIIEILAKKNFIQNVILISKINESRISDQYKSVVLNSYYENRSGDIQLIFKPNCIILNEEATSHGSWENYDTHIPLIWYGYNIHHHNVFREIHMCDIAPTIAALLKIQMPSGSVGKVIEELMNDFQHSK